MTPRIAITTLLTACMLAAGSMAQAQDPLEEALKVPGAKPVLPVSAAKKPFDTDFIAEARK